MGIAHQLSDVNIPYLIVMRAEIPNRIAQDFLELLLFKYSKGADFVRAFQLARERISLSTEPWLRFANWLPILFHNPFSHPVSWQDFISATNPKTVQHRLWASLGLSLVIAGLSMGLKSIEPIDRVENLAIDLSWQFKPSDDSNIVLLEPPLRVLGKLNNPQILTAAIKKIERDAKPQAFITDSNLSQYLSNNSLEPQWRLNNRIFDRLNSITTASIVALSSAQIEDIFNDKIIIIIERNSERNSLINTPLTANRIDLSPNPNLLKTQSKLEEFIWIFAWCNLSILAVWKIGLRLFVPTTIAVVSSQIISGGLLLMMGNGVPIVITSIAIITAGIIIFKIDSGLLSQYQC